MIQNISIGTDVEFFLRDKNTGEIVSAEGIIQGSKHNPHRFDENPYYGTSLDNVLAEGNIPPAKTPYQFYRNVKKLISYLKESNPKYDILSLPSHKMDHKWLQTEHAQIAGCEASFNAWTGEDIHAIINPDGYRGASFHIHVGYNDPSEMHNYALIKAMDLYLGVPSILIEPKNDRKTAGYGFAGNGRHKEYGVEYRTLSSYFSSNRKLIQWAFNNTKKAVEFINDKRLHEIEQLGQKIQDCINNENKEEAQKFINQFKIDLPNG